MIPFFVVDRPMSLNIVKTFFVHHSHVPFGLMSHAMVSEGFRRLFSEFPCEASGCWLRRASALPKAKCGCPGADGVRRNVYKAVDCGIFARDRQPPYPKLFSIYDEMGADFGIMKDVFGDSRATIESAKRALEEFEKKKRRFELILVAQGKTIDEYLRCLEKLIALGTGKLAIGGLLARKKRSARYSSAGTMERMETVLSAVRREFPKTWLFVLGCYHHKRHELFERFNVFGSDYKGWIFNYTHRFDTLTEANSQLLKVEQRLRRDRPVHKQAAHRHRLARQAEKLRTAYATTKNKTKASSARKSTHRADLARVLTRLSAVDTQLSQMRIAEAERDGLPADYKRLVKEFARVTSASDQSIRVAEVHRYFETKVLPKMKC